MNPVIDIDYKVYIVSLPRHVNGAIRIDDTGFASIYISDALSYAEKKRALMHELRHLRRGDMYNMRPIQTIEGGAHL